MHLVITTLEDPRLRLARLRARGQMAGVRAGDLRFGPEEAAEFLNRAMGLELTAEEIAALDMRTEGWIAAFLGYLMDSFAVTLLADYEAYATIFEYAVVTPAFTAELSFALWLSIKVVKSEQPEQELALEMNPVEGTAG